MPVLPASGINNTTNSPLWYPDSHTTAESKYQRWLSLRVWRANSANQLTEPLH